MDDFNKTGRTIGCVAIVSFIVPIIIVGFLIFGVIKCTKYVKKEGLNNIKKTIMEGENNE